MIAIDLDGTLLSPLGQVTPRARDAVHRALRAGLLVVFATGRNWTESKTVLDAVQHYDTAVFVGGAMVIDTQRGMTLHRVLMDGELARSLCRDIEALGEAALVLQDTGSAGVDYFITADATLNRQLQAWIKATAASVQFVDDLPTRPHDHTVRVGVVSEAKSAAKVKTLLDERYGDRVFHHSIRVPAYGVEVVEIFDPSVNKWQGILQVAEQRGIRPEQIIAIGDDVNDLHMIRHAGLGVAMGNAIPEVKAIAKRIIGTNAEEGLATFLDELVEQHAVEPDERPNASH
jgi:Cof subfamily protein (haloacid dehalogenase superfamily)